jgi:hypothetical protein
MMGVRLTGLKRLTLVQLTAAETKYSAIRMTRQYVELYYRLMELD